jgi:hypothetical protein
MDFTDESGFVHIQQENGKELQIIPAENEKEGQNTSCVRQLVLKSSTESRFEYSELQELSSKANQQGNMKRVNAIMRSSFLPLI